MSNEKQIHFKIKGYADGKEITPDNIPMSLLISFAKDVSELIMSYNERKKNEDIIVSIAKGSLDLCTNNLKESEINIINAELDILTTKKDYTAVRLKTAMFVQNMVNAAKKYQIKFVIEDEDSPNKFIFDSGSDFSCIGETLVDSELYIYGEIQDMGGVKNPNIHIRTDDGTNITINCKKYVLKNDHVNRLYKYTGVRVNAKYNITTKEYQSYNFIEFVEYNPVYDKNVLANSIEQGTKAWSKIKDHNKWLRDIRGYE